PKAFALSIIKKGIDA
ncbi:hypothetical protein A2U01_0040229, partial [Trifolium medium]|nr:hypothetical protein [Trifolium medium]